MIDKSVVNNIVAEAIDGTDLFIVDVSVDATNRIVVEIDSLRHSIDVDTCADLTRKIEAALDRDVEDYELEVGSAGLTSPFKVREQFLKNQGNPVDVLTRDGRKLTGELTEVADDTFTVVVKAKERVEGHKRPVEVEHPTVIAYADARRVAWHCDF